MKPRSPNVTFTHMPDEAQGPTPAEYRAAMNLKRSVATACSPKVGALGDARSRYRGHRLVRWPELTGRSRWRGMCFRRWRRNSARFGGDREGEWLPAAGDPSVDLGGRGVFPLPLCTRTSLPAYLPTTEVTISTVNIFSRVSNTSASRADHALSR
jgi:hypothetical protein